MNFISRDLSFSKCTIIRVYLPSNGTPLRTSCRFYSYASSTATSPADSHMHSDSTAPTVDTNFAAQGTTASPGDSLITRSTRASDQPSYRNDYVCNTSI